MINLTAAGLTSTEAKCYTALLQKKAWKPADLARNVQETRTNAYKILDKLVELGLAERFDKDKKLHYRATNPDHLLELGRELRASREEAERELELHAQTLMREYVKTHYQPGIRFYQGKDEIGEIFKEISEASEPVYFMSTLAGIDFYGYDHMHNLRMLAVNKSVKRHALTPDTELATADYAETDKIFNLSRTWLASADYTAPVEWGVFEGKLYIISFGEEALGMVVESPQIANAFKQIYKLLERGQRNLPEYNQLPRLAQKKAKLR